MITQFGARPPYIEFKQIAIQDKRKSVEMGRVVTKDVNMAFITQPGSKDTMEIEAENWIDKLRKDTLNGNGNAYPFEWIEKIEAAYKRWKEGKEMPVNGTSVRFWPVATPAQIENLIALRITTVEDVAAMNDDAMARYGMGGRELREQARAWLQSSVDIGKSATQIADLQAQLKIKEDQIEALEKRLSALEVRRGRPPKVEIEAA